jgi:hypothetical protein
MTDEPPHRGNHDRVVGERLRAALVLVEAPPADLDRLVAQARQRRTRRLAAALALAGAVLAAGVALPLAVLAPDGEGQRLPAEPRPAPATGPRPAATQPTALPAPRPGWVWHRDTADHVAIQTPAAWHFSSNTGVNAMQPMPLLMVGTGPLPAGGECAPTRAITALPRDGALFWVIEYAGTGQDLNPYEFPPRPNRSDLGPLAGPKECIGERTHQVLFQQAGRFFQVEVLFGPAAPHSLRAAVLASLESFRPEPAAVSLAEPCRRRWVFCPEAAWVFRVINRAGLFHWGNTGGAIQVGPQDPNLDPGRKLDLWTTRGGPLPPPDFYQVAVADGITVYGDGSRLLWRVQGLNVWVQAGQRRSALPRGAMLTKLVRASRAVAFVPDRR